MAKVKKIKPGEPFQLLDTVYVYEVVDDKSISIVKQEPEKKAEKGAFVPPTLAQVQAYFTEKGYSGAETFFNYYASGIPAWSDRDGNPVRSWKAKANSVWFTSDRKLVVPPPSVTGNDHLKGMVY